MKQVFIGALLSSGLLLSGCATVVNGTTQK